MGNEGAGKSLASGPVWVLATALTLGLAGGLLAADPGLTDWAGWRPATCLPDACFCELRRPGLLAQPVNAISSLVFLIPGLALVLSLAMDRGAPHSSHRSWYGLGLILIGLGSAFFHASLSFVGQTIDVAGMYLIVTWALVAAVERRAELSRAAGTAIWIGLNAALVVLLVTAPALRRWLFGAVVVAVIGIELSGWSGASPRARRLLLTAAGILAAGFAIWALDLGRIWCSPPSLLQGHAVWHVAAAVSATLLYRYVLARTSADRVEIP